MDEVSFKDIRVLPISLDLKGNSSKSLSDLLGQLQSGSILKGLIVGSTAKGEVIFHTSFGRFAVPNELGLQRGDTITIRFAAEGEQISGTIMTINNVSSNSNSTEPITVAFVKNNEHQPIFHKPQAITNVIIDDTIKLPEQIKGIITYLNLSNLNKSSLLYKSLEVAANQNVKELPITFRTSVSNQILRLPLEVQAEVSGNGKDGAQLIKTNFGIITTEGTKMPIGQKMILEIININNQEKNINIKKEVTDFMFHLSKNWLLMKNLPIISFNDDRKKIYNLENSRSQASQNIGSIIENQISEDVNISNLQKFEFLENLSKSVINKTLQGASLTSNQKSTNLIIQENSGTLTNQGEDIKNSPVNMNTVPKNLVQTAHFAAISMEELMNKAPQILGGLNTRKGSQVENDDISIKEEIRQRTLAKTGAKTIERQEYPNETKNINKFLKTLSDQEALKKLSSEYRIIKELFITSIKNEIDSHSWQSVMIPFYNGQKVEQKEVKINRPGEHLMRFLIEINLEALGEIRVDGLIKFKNDNSLISFDLIMQSKNPLDLSLENSITNIFNSNKQISGIKGTLSFDKNANFDKLIN